jgi:hypothetical protein
LRHSKFVGLRDDKDPREKAGAVTTCRLLIKSATVIIKLEVKHRSVPYYAITELDSGLGLEIGCGPIVG